MKYLKKLNPNKLFVNFKPGVTSTQPIVNRRYTLTHSDETADLFLTIGLQYAYEELNAMRDEVLGEWTILNDKYTLIINLLVDGQFGPRIAAIRDRIFRRELPLALEAIRYGDREFFDAHPQLDYASIYVKFNSSIPEYNRIEYWGMPVNYK